MRAIRSYRCRVRDAVCSVLVLGVSAELALGAVFHIRAVRVNKEVIPRSAYVSVNPGDQVDVEFYVSGWAGEIEAVKTWQITLDAGTYFSGVQGSLTPLGWEAPFLLHPCLSDEDCGGGVCGPENKCWFQPCSWVADCEAPFVCRRRGDFDVCYGAQHDPPLGAFIDEHHPEYVFGGISQVISAVSTAFYQYRYGATLFLEDGTIDEGGMYYLATLRLVVSDDALGVFTVGVSEFFLDTFVSDRRHVDARLVFDPLTIDVLGGTLSQLGACCSGRQRCDDLPETECSKRGGLWQRGQACGAGKQSCVTGRPLRVTAQD